MPYLRSPIVHHVHPNPFHLKQYFKKMDYAGGIYGKYKRPKRDMFMDHTAEQVKYYRLTECHIKDTAVDIKKNRDKWCVVLESGEMIYTQNVIIASGCNHKPKVPEMYEHAQDVQHIFEDVNIQKYVVGSRISAAHLALKLIYHDNE